MQASRGALLRRPRRALAALPTLGLLTVGGCTGGDSIPNEPAEEAGTGSPGGTGPGTQGQPAATPGISDPTDDLTKPTPGS